MVVGAPWILLCLLIRCSLSINYQVSVELNSSWKETPILAEAAEYLAQKSPRYFWNFIDRLAILSSDSQPSHVLGTNFEHSARVIHEIEEIVLEVQGLLPGKDGQHELQRRLFRLILSSRALSPAVETANHMAAVAHFQQLPSSPQNCPQSTTWARIGSTFICTIGELEESVHVASSLCSPGCPGSASDDALLSDNVYPATNNSNAIPRLILHGDLREKEFYSWHEKAKILAVDGQIIYIFRHFIKNASESKTPLNGYGVELALKSTEYKAMDDQDNLAKSGTDGLDVGDDVMDTEPVQQGFNFTRLFENHPDLVSQLNAFQRHLALGSTEMKPLKAWQMKNLGMQTAQAIMDAENAHPASGLMRLQDVSQNFPSRAFQLSQQKVSRQLKDEVEINQNILSQLYGVSPGSSLFLLNGLVLSPSTDIYALLDLLCSESYLLSQLRGLGLSTDQAIELLQASSTSDDGFRLSSYSESYKQSVTGERLLDLRTAPVLYLNDIEANSGYADWSSSMHALFMPSPPGSLRQIRMNIFTLVLVVDPAEPKSIEMIKMAEALIVKKIGIRVGILFSVDPATASTGRTLARAFNYLTANAKSSPLHRGVVPGLGFPGAMTALSFLTDVYAETDSPGSETVELKFRQSFPGAHHDDVFVQPGSECSYDFDTKKHHSFLEVSGIKASTGTDDGPSLLLNGMLFSQRGILKLGGFQETVFAAAMEQVTYFQHAAYEGRLYEGLSVGDLLAADDLLVSRVNHRLLSASPPVVSKFSVGDGSDESLLTPFVQFGQLGNTTIGDDTGAMNTAPVGEVTNVLADQMRYLLKGDLETGTRTTTVWIILGDVEPGLGATEGNLVLLEQAAKFMRRHASASTRLGFIFNPSASLAATAEVSMATALWGAPGWFTRAMLLIGQPAESLFGGGAMQQPPKKYMNMMAAKNFAIKLIEEALGLLRNKRSDVRSLADLAVSGLNQEAFLEAFRELSLAKKVALHTTFAQRALHLRPGDAAIVINGRVYGPLAPDEPFASEDLRLAEQMCAHSAGVTKMADRLTKILPSTMSANAISELVWRVASVLESAKWRLLGFAKSLSSEGIFASGSSSRVALRDLRTTHSGFRIPVNNGSSDGSSSALHHDIVAVIDPASHDAQRLSHILRVLHGALPCTITVILNPVADLSDLPLKSFYRFVWQASLSGDDDDDDDGVPRALFDALPGKSLLTLAIDAPHNWMVAPVRATEDLDNLRLSDISAHTGQHRVEAEFELEYLLLEGHCLDESSRQPPRGLQFTLGTAKKLDQYDTIVMANLGYFQLKANPGAWHLNLREGRTREIYEIVGHQYADSPQGATSVVAVMDSFRPKIIRISVQKKPGHLKDTLLSEHDGVDEQQEDGAAEDSDEAFVGAQTLKSMWSMVDNIMNFAHNVDEDPARNPNNETLNIFSLASGHLYERFLRIMMLTVTRNTKSPVKFWFLKNYLSPSFKEFIPHMAAEYGFEYELVQYQWPRWLHAQKEKQRIIWGYKILFLDVLFPLSVKKIIFVDADQIVRTDLQELVNLDLGGAPYGYTPFCDSRTEMEGFRFWKKGYWATHLGKRPYHISALYVVDLLSFRKMAAGDRLRGQYHALSKDPNSLSNLDQDLPNNMIHQVPIKSLPQDWLWCETWCSDESKVNAKTIDLCNNPMTKEPKLSAAMRIIPDWGTFDAEIKALQRRVATTAGTGCRNAAKPHTSNKQGQTSGLDNEKVEAKDEL